MKLATTQIYSIKCIWLRSALPLACKNFLTPLTTEFSELAKVQLKTKMRCVKIELPLTSILAHPFYIFRDSACFTSKHLLPFV